MRSRWTRASRNRRDEGWASARVVHDDRGRCRRLPRGRRRAASSAGAVLRSDAHRLAQPAAGSPAGLQRRERTVRAVAAQPEPPVAVDRASGPDNELATRFSEPDPAARDDSGRNASGTQPAVGHAPGARASSFGRGPRIPHLPCSAPSWRAGSGPGHPTTLHVVAVLTSMAPGGHGAVHPDGPCPRTCPRLQTRESVQVCLWAPTPLVPHAFSAASTGAAACPTAASLSPSLVGTRRLLRQWTRGTAVDKSMEVG